MLDHTQPYVKWFKFIAAELASHAHTLGNCRGCVGVAFLYLLCACLSSLTTFEWSDQPLFAKKGWGTICYPQLYNFYCIILKMVIFNDAIKKIQNWGFCVFLWKKSISFWTIVVLFNLSVGLFVMHMLHLHFFQQITTKEHFQLKGFVQIFVAGLLSVDYSVYIHSPTFISIIPSFFSSCAA